MQAAAPADPVVTARGPPIARLPAEDTGRGGTAEQGAPGAPSKREASWTGTDGANRPVMTRLG